MTSLATDNLQHHLWPGDGTDKKRQSFQLKVLCQPEQPPFPFSQAPGKLQAGMIHSRYSLHSDFLGTRPILVQMFRSKKKTIVLAPQITSATRKAVLQL